jgi:hypothetical protein
MTAIQGTVRRRRYYQAWIANETLEDYALRYAARSFRKWPMFVITNTALGGISFLALEAIGGAITLSYGFSNAFPAILVVCSIVFITNLPIAYYSSRYNIDMDLLTRGAGFGYIGSTITSLIYACFTFIFFALEAAIMAQALEIYFDLPLVIGYFVSSLVIIPITFLGVTLIRRLQLVTQPIWVATLVAPLVLIFLEQPEVVAHWGRLCGRSARRLAVQLSVLRCCDRGPVLADRTDWRAGRLSALPAGQDRREPDRLVAGGDCRRPWLGRDRGAEDPRRQPARGTRDRGRAHLHQRRRADPYVHHGLRVRQRRPLGGGHGGDAVRADLADQDQRHQRVCRLVAADERQRDQGAPPHV